jgi:hypothetical protein
LTLIFGGSGKNKNQKIAAFGSSYGGMFGALAGAFFMKWPH